MALPIVYVAAGLWERMIVREKNRAPAAIGAVLALSATCWYQFNSFGPGQPPDRGLWFRVLLISAPVTGYLWYTGARRTLEGLQPGKATTRFGVQALILTFGILAAMATSLEEGAALNRMLYGAVVVWFGGAIMLMLAAREEATRSAQRSVGEGAGGPALSARLQSVIALFLIGVALGFETLLDGTWGVWDLLGSLARLYEWLVDGLLWILLPLVVLLFRMLEPLLAATRWPALHQNGPAGQDGLSQVKEVVGGPDQGRLVEYVKQVGQVTLVVVGLTVGLLVLIRLRRNASGPADETEEERISLNPLEQLRADLASLLRGRSSEGTTTGAYSDQPVSPSSPRGLFQRLQRWAEERGVGRHPGETPRAFAARLSNPVALEVAALYADHRYGDQVAVAERLSAAAAALSHLETDGEQAAPK